MIPKSNREFVCDPCGYRHFITPIPAACALILDAQKRLLVTRRAHEPGLGKLGLPGGVIEGHESGEEAVARETMEEVGLNLPVADFRYFVSLPNLYLFQNFLWPTIDLFYLAEVHDFSAVVASPEEVSETFTLLLSEINLDEFAFESNAEAVRRLQEWQAGLV
jgi:ADP-ribose pyrophosphatase YjhB (NUDIX family)